jgi:tetratricopeptide (TPR) repeat protein
VRKKAHQESVKKVHVRRVDWKLLVKALAILAFAFAAYSPAVTNGFIWDDDVMLTDNDLMKEADGLWRIWFSTELSDYFPLTSTSFWIEWRLWGTNPIGYNVTNILLHALSGIALWRVLLRLKVPGAWLASALFVVHPVCVASVDWIAERKNVLSLLFYLGAILCYLRFQTEESKRWYRISLALFLCALLSKTSVVVLPIVLLLCHWWIGSKMTWQTVRKTIPFFVLALFLGLVTVWFQLHEVLLGEAKETDTFLTRVLGGSRAIWFYLSKILWPVNLSMIYPQWSIHESHWTSYVPGLLWCLMLFLFWRFRQEWGRGLLFAFGYFTTALLPVLGFFDMNFLRFSQVADHLQYIAVPGIVALFVSMSIWVVEKLYSVSRSAKRREVEKSRKRDLDAIQLNGNRPFPRLAAAITIFGLSILTWRQSSLYQDEETLWRDTIQKNPTAWIGYHNLADRLAELHRYDEAASCYQAALNLKPDHANSHNNLGSTLHLLGRADEAIDEFLDAIQNKPELAEAHQNLGFAYYRRNEFAKALECYNKAAQLKPDYGLAYLGAGNCELQLGNVSTALNNYFTAQRYIPTDPDVQYNIGIILSVRGETNSAIRFLQHALRLNPSHKLAQKELQLLIANTDLRP